MNRRDRTVVVLLVLVLAALGAVIGLPRSVDLAASREEPESPDVSMPPPAILREGIVGTPESITPVTARNRADRSLVGLVFSGLVRLGPGDTYQPDLAESWTSDASGRTWTFTIRPGAVWQDGVPVTADDVVYTVQALQSPDAAGAAAGAWADVTAEAVDPHTVRLTTGTPIGSVLALARQPLLPAHLLADVPLAELATSEFAQLPVGSGSFSLTELDQEHAVLVPAGGITVTGDDGPVEGDGSPAVDSLATPWPQPTAGLPRPYLDQLELRFYPDEDALAQALADGEVDMASGLSAAAMDQLPADAGLTRYAYPTTTLSAVLLNQRPSRKELRDPKVRTALLAALDRDALVGSVLDGNATRADALIPPTSWAFDADAVDPVAYDRKAAAKALQDAGWTKKDGAWVAPDGKAPYELEVLAVPPSSNPRLAAVADWVRESWSDFGFKVVTAQQKGMELATSLRKGTFTAAVVDIAERLEPDLYPLLATSQVQSTGSNLAGYQDAALDPLLEAARKPGTEEEQAAAWKALLTALAARQPILPLAWNDDIMLARGVEGVTPRLIADTGDRYWDVLAWRLAADR